jgi:TPR repeat protein
VRADDKRAFDLYRRAAESGSARAQYHLASCYSRGTGVEPDPARARELMLDSARGGYDFAQLAVARAYLEGVWGFPESLPRGAAWLRIAANGGNEEARKKLDEIEPTMSQAERVAWYAILAELQKKMR